MKRIILTVLAVLVAIIAWTALVFIGGSEGWGRSPLTASDDSASFVLATRPLIEAEHQGNFSMLLLEEGAIAEAYDFSIGEPVDRASVFQVASLGKWITAWGVMSLVEDGALDLDRPVSDYLTRWQLPSGDVDSTGVTVRRLLSHTAGLDDALGYDGFERETDIQTLEASLTRANDAAPGKSGRVKLGAEPGSEWRYSGGGYTLLQLVIEEVTGQAFADYMADRVFGPLGMHRTTFRHDEALRIGLAQNFGLAGAREPYRWYTALAATSLFTSSEDLAIFIAAQTDLGDQSVLSTESLTLMRVPHASQMGANIWGLGAMLYAPNNQGDYIIGHDGSNGPAINTAARFDPDTGDGIVILSTGSEALATKLAGEWVFWKSGNIDSLMFLMSFNAMLVWVGVGSGLILLCGVLPSLRSRRSKRSAAGDAGMAT